MAVGVPPGGAATVCHAAAIPAIPNHASHALIPFGISVCCTLNIMPFFLQQEVIRVNGVKVAVGGSCNFL